MDKFLDVDVIDTLKAISDQITFGSNATFKYDQESIRQIAVLPPEEKPRMLWMCEYSESDIFDARDAYIQKTVLSERLAFYQKTDNFQRVKLYGVEIADVSGGNIRGNIYEYDPKQYALFATQNTHPYTDLTLVFEGGEKLCIPKGEMTVEKQDQLETEHGKIVWVRRESADEAAVQRALQHEQTLCAALPIGDLASHLQRLDEQRIQAEAEHMVSRLQQIRQPNYPLGKRYVIDVPLEFAKGASGQNINRLTSRLQELLNDPHLYIGQLRGINGLFAVASKSGCKISIKDRLAVKPVRSSKPITKTKIGDAR